VTSKQRKAEFPLLRPESTSQGDTLVFNFRKLKPLLRKLLDLPQTASFHLTTGKFTKGPHLQYRVEQPRFREGEIRVEDDPCKKNIGPSLLDVLSQHANACLAATDLECEVRFCENRDNSDLSPFRFTVNTRSKVAMSETLAVA